MQKMMLRIKFRYAFYGKTEHSFESGIMKIKVIQRDTEVQMKEIKLKAMAKINLGLDVTRKREDGYHEVRMIMQSINMYDQIRLSPLEEPQIRVKTNVSFLPVNEDNLVYKAAKLLMDFRSLPVWRSTFENSFRLQPEWVAEVRMRQRFWSV